MKDYLAPSYIRLPHYWAESAWTEHVPFAFWLVSAMRPNVIVELGTHFGMSYFAFCQAVSETGLDARCMAVDTWAGDEHAGFYSENVFEQVRDYNEHSYQSFSNLLRMRFDQALEHVADSSIDILHVDGRHFYEDVKQDFETWMPKLSSGAVVLFHDTEVRERGFGVWKLWEELRTRFPSFEFKHGHGLGVLGFGNNFPDELSEIFTAGMSSERTEAVRQVFATCGESLSVRAELDEHSQELARIRAELAEVQQGFAESQKALEGELARALAAIVALQAELAEARGRPWRTIGAYGKFQAYKLISASIRPLFPKASSTIAEAAVKHDPKRSIAKANAMTQQDV